MVPLLARSLPTTRPLVEWTSEVNGKTVTVALSESQALLFPGWLDNSRLYALKLAELEEIEVTDRLLPDFASFG